MNEEGFMEKQVVEFPKAPKATVADDSEWAGELHADARKNPK
jgi:hypothetical protein